MVVKLSLTPEDEQRIARHLSTGRFEDAADLVRHGLALIEDQDREREDWLDNDVRPRLTDIENRPERFLAASDVFADLAERHRKGVSAGS
ncbi:ribbon-helix-helix domain-containing protein [Affinirhizobium pseudoryzae]|uniref:ribbon-helix-helix domain-containing protein n=1 Tax=Allorhizobium pseudoryzae TaxID=379684 RepID=UPI0013EC20D0|nr:hypothetical protein [Allorhizobium pseudoryzae]